MKEFLFPRSVAVVGASPRPESIGGQILLQLLRGFRGRTYAVNPKYRVEKIGGREVRFYKGVSQLPEAPELVVATPADVAPRVVDEAGQAGARAAVVVSGGFAEVGRRDLEEELVKAARRHGVKVLGPNCIGVYNAFNGLDTMFLPAEKAGRPPPRPHSVSQPERRRHDRRIRLGRWGGNRGGNRCELRQQGGRHRERLPAVPGGGGGDQGRGAVSRGV